MPGAISCLVLDRNRGDVYAASVEQTVLRRFPEAAQPTDRHSCGVSCICSFCGADRASKISRSCISCVHIHTARACKGGPRAVGSVKTGQLRGKRSLSLVYMTKSLNEPTARGPSSVVYIHASRSATGLGRSSLSTTCVARPPAAGLA